MNFGMITSVGQDRIVRRLTWIVLAAALAACSPEPQKRLLPSTALTDEELATMTEDEWKKKLTPEQYEVCREKGTEPAFTGIYNDFKKKGAFACVACGVPLFDSETKYDSDSGWPSFWKPISEEAVAKEEDRGFLSTRTEVLCARCGSHLGHVFDDYVGPEPTGLRYCINSVALQFVDEAEKPKKE